MKEPKVILITGASSGFGKESAIKLAQEGNNVFATMRNVNGKNKAVADELSAMNNITVVELDVTSDASVDAAINTIISDAGRIDVLVNNAGAGLIGISETFSTKDVEEQFEINLFGVFRVTKAVLPYMRKQKDGLLVNVSSVFGRLTTPLFAVYCSSKYALEGLAEAWRYELSPVGIDSVIVEPGAFPTTNFFANAKSLSVEEETVANDYGDLAVLPEKIGAMFTDLVEAGNAQNPLMVSDAIAELINTPKGERPLRTVVDGGHKEAVGAYNDHVKELQKATLEGFMMGQFYN